MFGFKTLFSRRAEQPERRNGPALQIRRFKAAVPDRITSFPVSLNGYSIADDVRAGILGLVAHSRHVSQNNDYLKAFYGHLRRNVIGRKGMQITPLSRYPSGKLDRGANKRIREAFEDWSRLGNCTVCGKLTFKDVQRIAITSSARDGNFLARIYRGPSFGKYGFQLQVLDFLMLDLTLNKSLDGGGYILNGIECNTLDKPVAYHLHKANPARVGTRGERVRIPAEEIIHLYSPYDQTASVLSVPWAHTALRRLHLVGEFEEAAATNARWGAAKMGFFTKSASLEAEEGYARKGENGETGEDDEDDRPDLMQIEPGMLETLPEGWDFKGFDPAYPNGEMISFNKVMLRGAAAGLGVAYTSIANDLEGYSYSGLRAGLGEERDEWTILQDWFADHFCGPIAAPWLQMALLTGALELPFTKLEKFSAIGWTGRGWRSVNPKDDATANALDLRNLNKSPQEIAAERGRSFDDVLDDFQEAAAAAAERKIDFWALLAGGADALVAASKMESDKD